MKNTNITVIDSIMGSGKTSWSIQYMNQSDKEINFIYITPFLKEVDRIKESVPERNFNDPVNKGSGKLEDLKRLIIDEKDIATTHKLFQNVDLETIELLKASNYTLILDEAMEVVDRYEMNKDDFKLLIDSGMVYVEDSTGLVRWNNDSKYQFTKYDKIKNLAKTENLYFFEDTILFWTFPVSVFKAFENVIIMTYLFQAQQQRYYYDMYDIEYSFKAVHYTDQGFELVDHDQYKPIEKDYIRNVIKPLINIHDGKLNDIGEDKNALSASWFRKDKNQHMIEKLKKNMHTYFRRHVDSGTNLNMWTCYKADRNTLKGKGYAGSPKDYKDIKSLKDLEKLSFIPLNTRATNNFSHKESLAYVINRFMNPYEKKFFTKKGIDVQENLFALSELIQWIWRSRIRKGEMINLYIPSSRMRRLLINYLDGEY